MTTLILGHKTCYPLGTHRKRVDNRAAVNAISFGPVIGYQWSALNATGIYPSSQAHWRLQEWRDAGVPERFWQKGLPACEELDSIEWSWLSMNCCITESRWAVQKTGRNPADRGKQGVKRSLMNSGTKCLSLWSCRMKPSAKIACKKPILPNTASPRLLDYVQRELKDGSRTVEAAVVLAAAWSR